jgi:hypothetical protein
MLLSASRVNPHFKQQYQQQAEFSQPSYAASIGGNFLKQLLEPEVALEKIAPLAGFHPHFSSLNDLYEAVQQVTETAGLPVTQKLGDGIASLLGFALNPMNMALGAGGGLLAKGAVKGVSALAPECLSNIAGKSITKLSTETVGSLSKKALIGSSMAATSLLPENLAESVTPDNKIDVSHLIQATNIAGGVGLALGVVPFAASVIRAKLFKHLESAEEKTWYQDYQKNPEDPALNQRASDILKKNNPDIGMDPIHHKINIPVLTPHDIKALQSVIPEELLAREGLNNPRALSDFVQKNALDRLKQNHLLSEGLQGVITELKNKGEKDWHAFLSQIVNTMDSAPSADTNTIKDYLKQRLENQLPAKELSEQRIAHVKDQFKHYQESLKKEELIDETSRSPPTFKKYQEFKTKSKVFQDLIHCLQRNT